MSHETVRAVLSGKGLPGKWPTVKFVVERLGGNVREFKILWDEAHKEANAERQPRPDAVRAAIIGPFRASHEAATETIFAGPLFGGVDSSSDVDENRPTLPFPVHVEQVKPQDRGPLSSVATLNAESLDLASRGLLTEAEERARRAIEACDVNGGDLTPTRVRPARQPTEIQRRLGKRDEALAQLQELLRVQIAISGEAGENVLRTRLDIARLHLECDDPMTAEVELREILRQGHDAGYGLYHEYILEAQGALGRALALQGTHRWPDARIELNAALNTHIVFYGGSNPKTLDLRSRYAALLVEWGLVDDGIGQYRENLIAHRRTYGQFAPDSVRAFSQLLCATMRGDGRLEDAMIECRSFLDECAKSLRADDPLLVWVRHHLAKVLLRQGKPLEAEEQLRTAIPKQWPTGDQVSYEVAEVLLTLARVVFDQGRHREASAILQNLVSATGQLMRRDRDLGKQVQTLEELLEEALTGDRDDLPVGNRAYRVLGLACECGSGKVSDLCHARRTG